jgi:small basic protein
MLWALIGILIGIIFGFAVNFPIPLELTKYSAVVIMGILDALFGAIRAEVTKDQFNAVIFVTGLVFNIILSIAITLLGDKLGLELYLAATFVFTFRIFSNVGITRRAILQNFVTTDAKEKMTSKD